MNDSDKLMAATTALHHAATRAGENDSASKVVTSAKRYYSFLTNPEGGRSDGTEGADE